MNQTPAEKGKAARRLVVLLAKINRKRVLALPKARREELFSGGHYYCPLCGSWIKEFLVYGFAVPRPNAWCPVCGSLERHRMAWLFLQQQTELFDSNPKKMLHIAPEPVFESKFKKVANLDYLTADLENPRAMVQMDITDIQYPEGSFDAILCSHVLEHVPDDRLALREFNRVLKSGGWALIMVPIISDQTFEDPLITSPQERRRLFGQHNHVRKYGPDFEDRLEEAGFGVRTFHASELVDADEQLRLGLFEGRRDERLFFCEKEPQGELSEDRSAGDQQPHLGELKNQLIEERRKAQQLENENRRLRARVQRLENQLQEIYGSNSWKLARTLSSARVRVSEKAAALLERVKSRD